MGLGRGGYNSGGILGNGRASKQEGETQVTTLIFEAFLDLHRHGRLWLLGWWGGGSSYKKSIQVYFHTKVYSRILKPGQCNVTCLKFQGLCLTVKNKWWWGRGGEIFIDIFSGDTWVQKMVQFGPWQRNTPGGFQRRTLAPKRNLNNHASKFYRCSLWSLIILTHFQYDIDTDDKVRWCWQ